MFRISTADDLTGPVRWPSGFSSDCVFITEWTGCIKKEILSRTLDEFLQRIPCGDPDLASVSFWHCFSRRACPGLYTSLAPLAVLSSINIFPFSHHRSEVLDLFDDAVAWFKRVEWRRPWRLWRLGLSRHWCCLVGIPSGGSQRVMLLRARCSSTF